MNNATFVDGSVMYFGEDKEGFPYTFQLASETYHNHTTLIIKTDHIKLLSNKTDFTGSQLKKYIVDEWFSEENNIIREKHNKMARDRRAKKDE